MRPRTRRSCSALTKPTMHSSAGRWCLKPDVTLIVGPGVTLFASRDPAVFAVSPGSCGIVSHTPGARGCKPLISVDHAPNSGSHG